MNMHGIEWVVRNHVPASTENTLHRWRRGEIELQMDMYPLIDPQNLSPLLTEFMCAINRCTTKQFGILDTMPGRRKDGHVPGHNCIDTLCNPDANLLFLDAARVHANQSLPTNSGMPGFNTWTTVRTIARLRIPRIRSACGKSRSFNPSCWISR